jgi:hypothetical protein
MKKITELQPRFHHYHAHDNSHVTVCELEDDKRKIIALGFAICSPSDNFCRLIGRRIAEGRARKATEDRESSNPVRIGSNDMAIAMQNNGILFKSVFVKG